MPSLRAAPREPADVAIVLSSSPRLKHRQPAPFKETEQDKRSRPATACQQPVPVVGSPQQHNAPPLSFRGGVCFFCGGLLLFFAPFDGTWLSECCLLSGMF